MTYIPCVNPDPKVWVLIAAYHAFGAFACWLIMSRYGGTNWRDVPLILAGALIWPVIVVDDLIKNKERESR